MNKQRISELFSDATINTQRLQELANLLAHLKKLNIEPLLVKGAGLIKTVYPHPALRVMGDIDLLVKPDDFTSARRLLISENYQSVPDTPGHFFSAKGGSASGGKNTSFTMHLDLHWDIWYLRKEEFDNLWKAGLSFQLNGVQAKTLAPEEHFIYIAVHSILHHGILDAVRLQDLIMLINHSTDFNWSLLVRKIRQYQLEILLSIVLERLQEIQSAKDGSASGTGSPLDDCIRPEIVPDYVFTQLRQRSVRGLNRFWARLMKQVIRHPVIPNIGHILKINAARGFRGKLHYFLSYLFPSELFMKEKYPLTNRHPLLLYCYYFHRPIYLTSQGIRLLSSELMK